MSVADPGFGQGGAKNFSRDFADVAKQSGERSEPIVAGAQGPP